ncbi:hypothetical protein GLOIN_2v1785728 [Rhizophagus clarus]|uniref:Uncharacterized protein n=1 Tax=Rhizophagus clarus TaxID=94130 RepID=A0A8H3LZX8_9GLOM|nr:hypothetical protein GLOIN_2v1785728 [Rhizophagus clarus]
MTSDTSEDTTLVEISPKDFATSRESTPCPIIQPSKISDEKTEQDLTEIDQLPCATNNYALKKSFKEKYDKMEDDLKWKLSCTGRFVEDVIYESVSDFTSEL